MKEKENKFHSFFSMVSETINGGERAFLDALSAIVPYTTAGIPAYLTYDHTYNQMGFPLYIAVLSAFTVEVLGVTSVSTAIRFFQWNKNHTNEKDKAPFWLAVATYAFYILITLSVNVILEVFAGDRSPAVIWAIGLFSLLSLPSGVLISVRAQFGEMLEDKREKAEQKKQERLQGRGVGSPALVFSKDVKQLEFSEVNRKSGGKFRK